MITKLAAQFVASALVLASHAEPGADVTYTCNFEGGIVVIRRSEEGSARVSVSTDGSTRQYLFDEEKLVATESGLPTYYFQSELKRWKRLDDKGQTIETTVCRTGPA